jgi:competence protein ComEC
MAVTLIVQPSYGWGDLGWQLSFAAFAGVMVLAPLIQAFFFGDKEEKMLRRIFIETISATIMTLPVILASFGQFSLVAPIANMVILPLIPIAMLTTFIAGISGLMLPGVVAEILGYPAAAILGYMVKVAEFMGGLPWAVQDMKIEPWVAVISYVMIGAICIYMKLATKYDLRSSSLVE